MGNINKMSFIKYPTTKSLLLPILAALLLLTSCTKTTNPNKLSTVWNEDSQGNITTSDLARLQEEVPFDIIVPTYLPEDTNRRFPVLFNKYIGNPVIISFSYSSVELYGIVYITESYPAMELLMDEQMTVYDVMGTEIYETVRTENVIIPTSSDILIVDGTNETQEVIVITSKWISNNVNFYVETWFYEQSVNRDIVRSMINDNS